MYKFVIWLLAAALLGGCTSVLHNVTDNPVGTDDISTGVGADITDNQLDMFIGVNIKKADPQLARSHINVNVYSSVVLITGEVSNKRLKTLAGDTARAFQGVRAVHNQLNIRSNSTWLARSADTVLTAKVKAKLVLDEEISAGDINVISEDSIVYLMGRVSQATGARTANRASETSGARNVVKIFDYTD